MKAAAPETAVAAAPRTREEVPVIVTTIEALPVMDLLARAETRLHAGEFALAVKDYELLLRGGASAELLGRIYFGYALALEGEGRLALAAEQLERRVALVPEEARAPARMDWLVRLLLLEQFERAGREAEQVAAARLGPDGRILLAAVRTLGLVAGGEVTDGDAALAPGWLALEEQGEALHAETKSAAAWLSFAQGELEGLRARRIHFDPLPDDVHAVLEARCRAMVAAQSAYAESMRLDAGALRLLAGERIAALYLDLHEALVTAPLGAGVTSGSAQETIARGALLLRYEVLLEKAEQMLRITLDGTRDTAAARPLRERLAASLGRVVQRRTAARDSVDGLPVGRADLSRILESLGAPPTAPQLARDGS